MGQNTASNGATQHSRIQAGSAHLLLRAAGGVQLAAGLAVAAICAITCGSVQSALSAVYGTLAAWLPALLSTRLAARTIRLQPSAKKALLALVLIEGGKIMLTVVLLLAAPLVVAQVNWLALLAGFVVTIKAAWVALWRVSKKVEKPSDAHW